MAALGLSVFAAYAIADGNDCSAHWFHAVAESQVVALLVDVAELRHGDGAEARLLLAGGADGFGDVLVVTGQLGIVLRETFDPFVGSIGLVRGQVRTELLLVGAP